MTTLDAINVGILFFCGIACINFVMTLILQKVFYLNGYEAGKISGYASGYEVGYVDGYLDSYRCSTNLNSEQEIDTWKHQ